MANRNLNERELKKAYSILEKVRKKIKRAANNDPELEFALRRKIYKELSYDERGKPVKRKKLKEKKRKAQQNLCVHCNKPLSKKDTVLDRLETEKGYTEENTNLICKDCDSKIQESRSYK